MLEKTKTPRLRDEERKKRKIMAEILSDEEKEFRLVLDEDRTSIEISTGEGKWIELVPTKDGDLEIYMEDNYQTRMLKKEFLKKISKQIKKEFEGKVESQGPKIKIKEHKNILAILLRIKAALERSQEDIDETKIDA